MQVLSTNKLIENIERKGIGIDAKGKKIFRRYNYYQVVNAYKNIFVDDIETIDNIKENIFQGREIERYKNAFNLSGDLSSEELFFGICKNICKKYDRQPVNSNNIDDYIKEIKEIDYYHHIYSNRVRYSDFVRIYKFEHELRTILLKYVLIIEECLKNVFVSYLNDSKVVDSFLMDINNYRVDSKSINESIDSIKLILDKQKNKFSKPIMRKKNQKINAPYWIVINELTIKETLKIINNLKDEHYSNIYSECLNQFTSFDIKDETLLEDEKKQYIDKMRNILEIISNFRNLLAHNQPLYLFNVKDSTTSSMSSINYDYPKVKNQSTMNSDTMSMFAKFFGSDRYNSRTQNVKIDLSWIIYTIYKIISTLDLNNTLYSEIINVYQKYNIVNMKEEFVINNYDLLEKLFSVVDEFLEYDYDSQGIIEQINDTLKYKAIIKRSGVEIKNYQNNIKKYRRLLVLSRNKSKYNIFQFLKRYTEYTGVDKSFFDKLK